MQKSVPPETSPTIKDINEILLQAYTAFLCGGSFLFIDAIDPDGGLNVELYKMMAEVKRELETIIVKGRSSDAESIISQRLSNTLAFMKRNLDCRRSGNRRVRWEYPWWKGSRAK